MAFGSLRELGSAFVRIFVRKDELSAGLKQAEQEVKQTTEKMQASGQQAAVGIFGTIQGLNKAFTDTIGATLKLISRITMIGTAVGVVIGLVLKMADAFGAAEAKAQELRKTVEATGKQLAGGEKEPLSSLLKAVAKADQEVQKLQQRLRDKSAAPKDVGFGGTSIQELQNQIAYATRTRERAIDNLRNYQRRVSEEQAAKDAEDAKKKADAFREAAELAAATTVERFDEYDPSDDPLLKGIEESSRRHEEAVKHVVALYYKLNAEATTKWGNDLKQAQLDAHAERLKQIEFEAEARVRAETDALHRISALRSSQRNQSASGDLRTITALIKRLVDKQ